MTPEAMLEKVGTALDALVRAGERYQGLFPSMLDPGNGEMLTSPPAEIPGQRRGDRAYLGSNLMHDESSLRTLYGMAAACGRQDYAEAADRYLRHFAIHCTATTTGLFPWGEHAYWHLGEDRLGNSYREAGQQGAAVAIHDHLRAAPGWLWQKLAAFNPPCVERFAAGLDWHWVDTGEAPPEYIRHAPIDAKRRPGRGTRSCDFPRHSGFYIFDLAFAWRQTKRADFGAQLRRFADYWWEKRDERGLCQIESRCPEDDSNDFFATNAPPQTLSLASSLLEAAPLVEDCDPGLASLMRDRAAVYIDGFFAAPHDLEKGVYVILCKRGPEQRLVSQMPVWGSVYGVWPASYVGLNCLCVYRSTGDQRLLEWAVSVGRAYAGQALPRDVPAPAMDCGMGLGLLADLYEITGDPVWKARSLALAETLVELFFAAPLPASALGIDWYDSQMGPGFLLHGLARTALLAMDREGCPLDADYTGR